MKNKILLGSVTLLSAVMVAACGNGEKKTTETTAAPTTEVTTATPTTTAPTTTASASSDAKEVSLGDTQRIGREDVGYINVPKDWIVYSSEKYPDLFRYSSPDKYTVLLLRSFSKDQFKLNDGEKWGAKAVADRMYVTWKDDKQQTSLEGVKTKFAGEEAILLKVTFTDGKTLYDWFFQKGDLVYRVAIEGSEETINSLRPILQNTWSLDPKFPRQY